MLSITPIHRVALIHNLCHHTPPVPSRYPDIPSAPGSPIVPPSRQRHHALRIVVELPVTLRRVSAVPAFAEVVVREFSGCGGSDRRGASVGGIGPTATARKSAGDLTIGTAAAWGGRCLLTNVSTNVRIVVALSVDAYELTLTVVKGST